MSAVRAAYICQGTWYGAFTIEMVSDKFHYNTEIQKIIEEEVGAYMQNQKELDEVCAIIQSRVQLYLNERDW